jgi:hypothetical protein
MWQLLYCCHKRNIKYTLAVGQGCAHAVFCSSAVALCARALFAFFIVWKNVPLFIESFENVLFSNIHCGYSIGSIQCWLQRTVVTIKCTVIKYVYVLPYVKTGTSCYSCNKGSSEASHIMRHWVPAQASSTTSQTSNVCTGDTTE